MKNKWVYGLENKWVYGGDVEKVLVLSIFEGNEKAESGAGMTRTDQDGTSPAERINTSVE